MTRAEYEAFNLLFDAVRSVAVSRGKHRIVDPTGRIRHLFRTADDALAFVWRLQASGLLSFSFQREVDGVTMKTFETTLAYWLDFADLITVVSEDGTSACGVAAMESETSLCRRFAGQGEAA